MDKKDRRKALKALAVGAPAVWAKPVVDSVVLPAHAQTSFPAGCYQVSYVEGVIDGVLSIYWEGGIGASQSTTFTYSLSKCAGTGVDYVAGSVVVAESEQDALDSGIGCIEGVYSSPDLPGNLLFFLCD
jgi:hypothetical protein